MFVIEDPQTENALKKRAIEMSPFKTTENNLSVVHGMVGRERYGRKRETNVFSALKGLEVLPPNNQGHTVAQR